MDNSSLLKQISMLERQVAEAKKSQQDAESQVEEKIKEYEGKLHVLERINIQLNQELKSAENKLEVIAKHIRDVVYEVDSQGFIVNRSNIFSGLLGYSPEEFEKKPFWEFVAEGSRERVQNFYANCVENRIKDSYYEVPVINNEGELVWFGQNVHIEFYENPQDFRAFVVASDITEFKQIRAEHELENKRLKHLISSMRSGILIEDGNRNIEMINQEFCKLFGISAPPEMLVGSDCSDSAEQSKNLFKDPESFVSGIETLLAQQKAKVKERLEMANGKILLRDYIPIWLNRENRGHMWIYKDVTELELKNREILENQRKYTTVIESLNLGVMEVDVEESITRVYPKFEELTGYKASELIGKNPQDIFLTDESTRKTHAEVLEERQRGISGEAYESIIRTKDGKLINVMIAGSPIMNVYGETIGSIGVHFDITDQKIRQKELEVAKKNQERITARLSHELRNPITAIDGKLALLAQSENLDEIKKELKQVSESVTLLKLITDDALAYSTLSAGNYQLNLTNTAFADYINAITAVIKSMAKDKDLEFHLSIDPAIPEYLMLDKKILGQILVNLLSNAVKFTDSGFIGLEIRCIEQDTEHCTLQLDVFDSGIGISEEEIKKVTAEYFRGSNVSSEQTGTGLGLSIVQEILQHLGSQLEISSEYTKGSCFSFKLPLKIGKQPNQISTKNDTKRLLKSVLIVEDDPQVRSFLAMVLQKFTNEILEARNASEGRAHIEKRQEIDLCIIDYQMPGEDGLSLIKSIREAHYNGIIFFISANLNSQLRHSTESFEIDELLEKPFTPDELAQILKKHFQILNPKPQIENESIFIEELNTPYLRKLYDGNREYIENAFRVFLSKSESSVALIKNSLRIQDLKALKFYLHKLKPSLYMVGLGDEADLATKIENRCDNNGDFKRIEKDVSYILEKLRTQKPLIEKQLNHLDHV